MSHYYLVSYLTYFESSRNAQSERTLRDDPKNDGERDKSPHRILSWFLQVKQTFYSLYWQTVPPQAIFRIFLSMHSNLLEGVEHDHLVQFPINVVMISKILLTFCGKPLTLIGWCIRQHLSVHRSRAKVWYKPITKYLNLNPTQK